jgi:hypothetical protein
MLTCRRHMRLPTNSMLQWLTSALFAAPSTSAPTPLPSQTSGATRFRSRRDSASCTCCWRCHNPVKRANVVYISCMHTVVMIHRSSIRVTWSSRVEGISAHVWLQDTRDRPAPGQFPTKLLLNMNRGPRTFAQV